MTGSILKSIQDVSSSDNIITFTKGNGSTINVQGGTQGITYSNNDLVIQNNNTGASEEFPEKDKVYTIQALYNNISLHGTFDVLLVQKGEPGDSTGGEGGNMMSVLNVEIDSNSVNIYGGDTTAPYIEWGSSQIVVSDFLGFKTDNINSDATKETADGGQSGDSDTSKYDGGTVSWNGGSAQAGGGGQHNYQGNGPWGPGQKGGGYTGEDGTSGTGGGGGHNPGSGGGKGGTGSIKIIRISASVLPKIKIESSTNINGNLAVNGSLSKSSGSFRIAHPLHHKQDTHDLVHSFIESPRADLIYSGMATLKNGGQDTVNIDIASHMTPGTFEAFTRNPRYFAINQSGFIPIKSVLHKNELIITAFHSNCRDNVYWQIVTERCDKHIKNTTWTDCNGVVIVEPTK